MTTKISLQHQVLASRIIAASNTKPEFIIKTNLGSLVLVLTLLFGVHQAKAQDTAFSYQGELSVAASPANGLYDVRFTIYDALTNGNTIAGPITNTATSVNNGLFAVTLDFGQGVFTGPTRWLQLDVRTNGNGAFTSLSPLQPVLPAPYAIMATSASKLIGTLPASQLIGPLTATQLPETVLTNSSSGVTLNGTFSGNGSGLTALNSLDLSGPLTVQAAPAVVNVGGSLAINGANVINALGQWVGSPIGLMANTIYSGARAPSASLGTNGDFYMDTSAHAIYGPKESGAWGGATSLIGPQGSQGPPGGGSTLASLGLQSGIFTCGWLSSVTVTFATPYPNTNYTVLLTSDTQISGATTGISYATVKSQSTNGFTAFASGGIEEPITCHYVTIPNP